MPVRGTRRLRYVFTYGPCNLPAAINPVGTIPAIRDRDGVVVWEACAILTYLATKYGWEDLYPSDPVARSKVDRVMHWHHRNTREASVCLFASKVRKDLKFPPGYVEHGFPTVTAAVKQVERWVAANDFITGSSTPTLADLVIFQELGQMNASFGKIFDFGPYPAVQGWFDRMAMVPFYDDITEVSKQLGDISAGVPQSRIGVANKLAMKRIAKVATGLAKL